MMKVEAEDLTAADSKLERRAALENHAIRLEPHPENESSVFLSRRPKHATFKQSDEGTVSKEPTCLIFRRLALLPHAALPTSLFEEASRPVPHLAKREPHVRLVPARVNSTSFFLCAIIEQH